MPSQHLSKNFRWWQIISKMLQGRSLTQSSLMETNSHKSLRAGSSQYGQEERYGVKNLIHIVFERVWFDGFIQSDLHELYWNMPPLFYSS